MSNITEKLDSLIESFVGEQSTNEEFERAQEFANQVLILAMQAEKKAISVMKSKIAKYESDDYVLFPKMPHPHVFECGFTRFMDLDPDYELEVDDLIGAWLKMIKAQKEVVMIEAQEQGNG